MTKESIHYCVKCLLEQISQEYYHEKFTDLCADHSGCVRTVAKQMIDDA